MKKSLFESVKLKSWIAIIALIPVLSSCLKTNDPAPVTPTSYVSFYHGSPDSGGLDLYLSTTKLNSTAFVYGNYSGYASFEVGQNQFRITPTGSSTGLKEATYTLEDGKLYSLFIVNTLDKLETVIVRDTAKALSSSGKAGIRVINLSPDAPILHLDGKSTTTTNKVITTSSVDFKSGTAFTEVDSDVYNFDVKKADGTVLTTVQNMSITSGRFYTLVIRGFVTAPANNTNTLTIQQVVNQ